MQRKYVLRLGVESNNNYRLFLQAQRVINTRTAGRRSRRFIRNQRHFNVGDLEEMVLK